MIYLDNAATSYPKPREMVDAVREFMESPAGNPGRGGHAPSRMAGQIADDARHRLARLVGAADPSRVVFTLNATDAINIALNGLLEPGDRVLVSSMEHNSVARPLRQLAARGFLGVEFVPNPGGFVSPDDFRGFWGRKVRLVVCLHASNVSGIINPVGEIAALAHENGALFLLDAAQTAGHVAIDAATTGADMIAFSGHKGLMGPMGTGALYVAENVELRAVRSGGTGTDSELELQPDEYPYHLESGTLNMVGIAGLAAALKFIESAGVEEIMKKQSGLVERLMAGLRELPGARIIGDAGMPRVPVVSVALDSSELHEVAAVLDMRHGIAVRAGLHCAPAAHRTFGTFPDGTLRVSPGYFNTPEEIDIFIGALGQVVAALS